MDLEKLTSNQFLLGNKNVCWSYRPFAEQQVENRKLSRQFQAYANIIWDRYRKKYPPTLNNGQEMAIYGKQKP